MSDTSILDAIIDEETWPEEMYPHVARLRKRRRHRMSKPHREEQKLPPIAITIDPCKNGYVVDFQITPMNEGEQPVNERLIARNSHDALKYVKRFVSRI